MNKMNLTLDEDAAAFREEVRAFLEAKLAPEMARAQRLTTTVFSEYELSHPWHEILARKGWAAPDWPVEHGGTGWDATRRYIFASEMERAASPYISPIGLHMVGPVLIKFGTAEQKKRFLPRILAAKDYWCQGFSEPGAGSDLASLKLRAVRAGDDYVLNGAKIWTTHAHVANWMIALVRTSDGPKPQAGISCLLVPMSAAGVQVRPIRTIGGDHEVNEVFFDDTRVPVGNLVADEGQGWAIAKYLLEFERGSVMAAAALRRSLNELLDRALAIDIDDPDIEYSLSRLGIDIDTLEMMELTMLSSLARGEPPGAESSILKLRVSQLQQQVTEMALQLAGESALRWETRRAFHEICATPDEDANKPALSRYLNTRANTIFGGSSEIQRTIIAKQLLKL